MVDESGWKQVHGDVFRAPRYAERESIVRSTNVSMEKLSFNNFSVLALLV